MIRALAAGLIATLLALPGFAAEVHYYPLPPGSAPRDVAPATDGRVWYTAPALGLVGLLDPLTGQSQPMALGAGSSPRGVVVAEDGAAWITDAGLNALVRVDPTGPTLKRYPLPGQLGDAGLVAAAFDRDGLLWFTGQNGFYGRLDPRNGDLKTWPAPRGAGPYGITVTPNGEVWYASRDGRHIARIDRVSGEAEVIDSPGGGEGPQRIWSDTKGTLWVSERGSGQLSRYDPLAKAWTHWALPSADAEAHALYVDEQDRLWLSDFHSNAILRFNPFSQRFTRFPSDQADARVLHLAGRIGEVWGAESNRDRLVVIKE